MKTCTKCGEHKLNSEFSGRKVECKSCQREYANKNYRERPKGYWKNTNLLRNYGITLEQYEQMLDDQGGHCLVCDKTTDLCVDHCHTTNKVRGILCRHHNSALGLVNENIDVMKKLIKYIERSF